MTSCPSCERTFENGASFCNVCGLALLQKAENARQTSVAGSGIRASQIFALALGLIVLAIQWFFPPSLIGQALLLSVAAGCTITIARWPFTARLNEKLVSYISHQKVKAKSGGKFDRWVEGPLYSICDASASLTKRVEDPFIRTGLQFPLFLVLGGIGTVLVATVAFLVIYFVIAFFLLLLVFWILSKLSDPDGEPLRPWSRRPKIDPDDVMEIKGGHFTKVGLINEDLGELHRRDFETLETSNLTKPNVRLVENHTILGADRSTPYRVEDENGEHLGNLVKESFSDGLRFEPKEDDSS